MLVTILSVFICVRSYSYYIYESMEFLLSMEFWIAVAIVLAVFLNTLKMSLLSLVFRVSEEKLFIGLSFIQWI